MHKSLEQHEGEKIMKIHFHFCVNYPFHVSWESAKMTAYVLHLQELIFFSILWNQTLQSHALCSDKFSSAMFVHFEQNLSKQIIR